jgi:hypothetical protein
MSEPPGAVQSMEQALEAVPPGSQGDALRAALSKQLEKSRQLTRPSAAADPG